MPISLERSLARSMGRCIQDFDLVSEGDRVMVAVSGGKDSYALLHLLERARRRAPIDFEIVAVHLDQGHPGYDGRPLEGWLAEQGFDYRILREDTYSVVKSHVPEGKTYCSLCSRLRRGVLYNAAQEMGCTKIALGHHRDDALETLLLNLFFAGTLSAMPPKLVSKDGRNTVIRPLLYTAEADLAAFAAEQRFPILPCDLCGSQDNLWRQQVKGMLGDLEQRIPRLRESMIGALGNVQPGHLLDRELVRQLGMSAPIDERGDAGLSGVNTAAASPSASPSTTAAPRRGLPVLE